MSFRHRTTIPIPSTTTSLSHSITWPSTRENLSGCHRRSAARIRSFGDTSGECAGDNKNSRIASGLSSSSGVRSSGASTTGQGIRSNVRALSRPSSGCRRLSSPHRASYERHALAISRARIARSSCRRSCRFCRSLRCCCCCCSRRHRASSSAAATAARRASASLAASRRRWSCSRARSSAIRRCATAYSLS